MEDPVAEWRLGDLLDVRAVCEQVGDCFELTGVHDDLVWCGRTTPVVQSVSEVCGRCARGLGSVHAAILGRWCRTPARSHRSQIESHGAAAVTALPRAQGKASSMACPTEAGGQRGPAPSPLVRSRPAGLLEETPGALKGLIGASKKVRAQSRAQGPSTCCPLRSIAAKRCPRWRDGSLGICKQL